MRQPWLTCLAIVGVATVLTNCPSPRAEHESWQHTGGRSKGQLSEPSSSAGAVRLPARLAVGRNRTG
jgi:hypothetical protein